MIPKLVVLAGCLLLLPSLAVAHPVSVGHVSAWMGDKWLEFYDAPCVGLDVMAGPGPVLLDVYASRLQHSSDGSVDFPAVDEKNYEVGVGLGKTWTWGSFQPRLSAGFARAWIKGRIRRDVDDDVDTRYEAWGDRAWLAIGGFWPIGSGPTLGVAARFSEIGHHDYPQLGGNNVAATLGWQWGRTQR